jgi:putative spermidine/putrescine transport system permease protein
MKRQVSWLAWIFYIIGALYFIVPLFGTAVFSLQKRRGEYSFAAYTDAFADPRFLETFLFSNVMAVFTILVSLMLIVPTAFWVHLRMPKWRSMVEFVTLMPFVIPAIVLVFGFIKLHSKPVTLFGITVFPSLTTSNLSTNVLLVFGYTVLALPYMYRAVDNGLRAMDVTSLTEAAQSLGAGWFTILWRVIMPNLRSALLSGALLTFAIVVGELTIASFLARPAFGPYLALLGNHRAYEPAALTIVTFALTWVAMGLIDLVTRGSRSSTVAGAR